MVSQACTRSAKTFVLIVCTGPIQPHTIVVLPNTSGLQLLMCYDNEGVYVDTYGKITKNVVLQWGELPTSVAYIGTGQIMGWGNKAIEIRYVCLSKTSSLKTNGQIASYSRNVCVL